MTESSPPQRREPGAPIPANKPSRWWLAALVAVNFLFVEFVFVMLGLTPLVPLSSAPGEAMEAVGRDAIIFVPLAFMTSLLLLIPILRAWQLRNQVWAASVGSWLPGVAIGVLFHFVGAHTKFFHVFVPIARALWE